MRDWEAVCESGRVLHVRCRQWRGGTNVQVVEWNTDHDVPKIEDDVDAVSHVIEKHSMERLIMLRTPTKSA